MKQLLTSEELLANRREIKERHIKYREAAERLTGGRVSPLTTPVETIDHTGAFVEIIVWVPKSEIEGELS